MPCGIGGVCGFIRFEIIEGPCPPLLSVNFLENDLGADVLLQSRKLSCAGIQKDIPLNKLSTGHVSISVLDIPATGFSVPPQARQRLEGMLRDVWTVSDLAGAMAKGRDILAGRAGSVCALQGAVGRDTQAVQPASQPASRPAARIRAPSWATRCR